MMYDIEISKVSFFNWRWLFGLGINLLILTMQPGGSAQTQELIAQSTIESSDRVVNSNTARAALEPKILSEINRVRTDPQGYARWLEEQQQYFDGIWLRLPGEKPIRTNRGKKALQEAIATLKEQQPLPPLETSEQTAAKATSELENFATANNIQFFSYGRTTATGIVMGLVVDDLFPDRRRRNSLLSPEAEDTGVVCKPDPRYAKVCAIAYSDSTATAEVAEAKPEPTATSDNESDRESVAELPDPTPAPEATPQVSEPKPEPAPEITLTPPSNDTESVTELPLPPQPQTPPLPTSEPEGEAEIEDAETENTTASADSDSNATEAEDVVVNEPEVVVEEPSSEIEEVEAEAANVDEPEVVVEEPPSETEEVEVEAADEDAEVALNSDSSRLLEQVERGALEEGDRVIDEDGSLYDFYPIEGKEGETYTIYLESDEFDAFVALVDSNGNTIQENDDISQENSNSRIRVTLPEDGKYNVIVNTYDEDGSGQYILTVTQ